MLISDPVASGHNPPHVVQHFVQTAQEIEAHQRSPMTKLICTMGPATRSLETLRDMIRAARGRLIMRINAAHGDAASWAKDLHLIREAARAEWEEIPIEIDTPGEKVRLGAVPSHFVLEPGDIVILS